MQNCTIETTDLMGEKGLGAQYSKTSLVTYLKKKERDEPNETVVQFYTFIY